MNVCRFSFQVTEYLVEPLRRCCKEQDPYVRKTAAICVAKLHDISPAMVSEHGLLTMLQDMLSDSNPMGSRAKCMYFSF